MTESRRPTKENVKTELREIAIELKQLADEVRLKLHLAGMDARKSWAEFEPRLIDFGKRMERGAEHAGEDASALAAELRERLNEFRKRIAH